MKKKQTQAKLESLSTSWFKAVLIILKLFSVASCVKKQPLKLDSFSFNLPRELQNTDPLLTTGSAKKYILVNLHRGLYYYDKKNKLIAHGAKNCVTSDFLTHHCTLQSKKWHDGSLIKSSHYKNSFDQIKLQDDHNAEALLNIKSIKTPNSDQIVFRLFKPDQHFKHSLSDIRLTPRKTNETYPDFKKIFYSGPYKLKGLNSSRIILENNEFYDSKKRPAVTGLFIDNPGTSLRMYESSKLNFLRYLETANIPKYKNVILSPVAKLDGLIFNLAIYKDINLRKALFHALNFKELQNIFHSKGTPGCLPVPNSILGYDASSQCLEHSVSKAKKFLAQTSKPIKSLDLHIPAVNWNDHIRFAEWVKAQWKTNLDIDVQIKQIEPKMFYSKIRQQKLSLYRKSLPLSDLSCAHAKEMMSSQPEFQDLKLSPSKSCKEFFKDLLDSYSWLPLGVVHMPHLGSTKYKGYYINMLEQMGLENLERTNTK